MSAVVNFLVRNDEVAGSNPGQFHHTFQSLADETVVIARSCVCSGLCRHKPSFHTPNSPFPALSRESSGEMYCTRFSLRPKQSRPHVLLRPRSPIGYLSNTILRSVSGWVPLTAACVPQRTVCISSKFISNRHSVFSVGRSSSVFVFPDRSSSSTFTATGLAEISSSITLSCFRSPPAATSRRQFGSRHNILRLRAGYCGSRPAISRSGPAWLGCLSKAWTASRVLLFHGLKNFKRTKPGG